MLITIFINKLQGKILLTPYISMFNDNVLFFKQKSRKACYKALPMGLGHFP